jgi:hypothetical protein
MKYERGDKILQISGGVFIRLGVIIKNQGEDYEVLWIEKHKLSNIPKKKFYPHYFIEMDQIFLKITTVEDILNHYTELEDYESCIWIRDNLEDLLNLVELTDY